MPGEMIGPELLNATIRAAEVAYELDREDLADRLLRHVEHQVRELDGFSPPLPPPSPVNETPVRGAPLGPGSWTVGAGDDSPWVPVAVGVLGVGVIAVVCLSWVLV